MLTDQRMDAFLQTYVQAHLITCASFEPRFLTIPDQLANVIGVTISGASYFFPRDAGSRWEAECTALQEEKVNDLQGILGFAPARFELDLVQEPGGLVVDDLLAHLKDEGVERVIVDLSTMPKAVMLPLIARLIEERPFDDVVATYTEVAAYTTSQLHSEPTTPEMIPPFDHVGPSRETDVAWLPILGFSPNAATEIYESFVDTFSLGDRIFPILGFPAIDLAFHERAFVDGTRGFLDQLRSGPLAHEHFKYASATDPFHTCDVILDLARGLGPIHCIGSPMGPKPMTLGMVLAALEHDITLVVSQARSYNPAYSVGSKERYAYPLLQGGSRVFGGR